MVTELSFCDLRLRAFAMFSPPPSTAAATAAADDAVKDVSLSSFVKDVIEASKTALVLVEFWATWCGPCKQLMPVLEKIARESGGTIRLAKIDVDRNQAIAQQMGVQSVPSVFAFVKGRPVDGFAGALPEPQIKEFLKPLLASAGFAPPDEGDDIGLALEQAEAFLNDQDSATARAVFLDVLERDPANAAAYAGLIRCLLAEGDTARAKDMLDQAPAPLAKDKALAPIRAALELAAQSSGAAGQLDDLQARVAQLPDDHQARFDLALALYAAGRRDESVDHLLDIVKRARGWNDGAARKQLVTMFEAFGHSDPLTIDARKRLSSLLFA